MSYDVWNLNYKTKRRPRENNAFNYRTNKYIFDEFYQKTFIDFLTI